MTAENNNNNNNNNNHNNVSSSLPLSTTAVNNNNTESSISITNVNVGVLGHVDSGKTSVVKCLSTLLSTAALDKSKESKQRGMTLDLGFSCFFINTPQPQHIIQQEQQQYAHTKQQIQITLVDCPGHASLIRTIIGGAQIIDLMLLVVDAYRGWQTQTTECLVLAELLTSTTTLIVVLNKIDQFASNERDERIHDAKTKIHEKLSSTRFAFAPIVGISACVGGEKGAAVVDNYNNNSNNNNNINPTPTHETWNIHALIQLLKDNIPMPCRNPQGSFYFAIDHCFTMRGRGTILTGTVLNGSIAVNDVIEFPILGLERKIKSIQMFHHSTTSIQQGDRAGLCIRNLDAKLLERGIAVTPHSIQLLKGALCLVRKVSYYAGTLVCGSKFHISIGHTTVMATVTFWGAQELLQKQRQQQQQRSQEQQNPQQKADTKVKNTEKTKSTIVESSDNSNNYVGSSSLGGEADMTGLPRIMYDYDQSYIQQQQLVESLSRHDEDGVQGSGNNNNKDGIQRHGNNFLQWALLDFQIPVYCPLDSLVIGSRLDTTIEKITQYHHSNQNSNSTNASDEVTTADAASCRLAFCGRVMHKFDPELDCTKLLIYVPKERRGIVAKLGDPYRRSDDGVLVRYELFGTELFKKETNMKVFIGMKVEIETKHGQVGEIKGSYGTEGQFRVAFPAGTDAREGDVLILRFRRYIYDSTKSMHQTIDLPTTRPGVRVEIEKKNKKKKTESKTGITPIKGEVVTLKGDVLENGKYSVAIIQGFYTPEINVKEHVGTKVRIPTTNELGSITGPFGKAGKCKVFFECGVSAESGTKAEIIS